MSRIGKSIQDRKQISGCLGLEMGEEESDLMRMGFPFW